MLASTVAVVSSRMSSSRDALPFRVEVELLHFFEQDALIVPAAVHEMPGLLHTERDAGPGRLAHQPGGQLALLGSLILEHLAVLFRRRPEQIGGGELLRHQREAGVRRRRGEVRRHLFLVGLQPGVRVVHEHQPGAAQEGHGVRGVHHFRARALRRLELRYVEVRARLVHDPLPQPLERGRDLRQIVADDEIGRLERFAGGSRRCASMHGNFDENISVSRAMLFPGFLLI